MDHEFKIKDRVRICRKVSEPGGGSRYIKVVEDGLIINRRFGHRTDWIQVLCPATLDGQLVNANPDTAEFFPVHSRYLQITRTGVAES